jgi:hypothetical protein
VAGRPATKLVLSCDRSTHIADDDLADTALADADRIRRVAKRSTASSSVKRPSSSAMRSSMNSMIRSSWFSSVRSSARYGFFGQKQTLEEAERVMSQIGAAYFALNKARSRPRPQSLIYSPYPRLLTTV